TCVVHSFQKLLPIVWLYSRARSGFIGHADSREPRIVLSYFGLENLVKCDPVPSYIALSRRSSPQGVHEYHRSSSGGFSSLNTGVWWLSNFGGVCSNSRNCGLVGAVWRLGTRVVSTLRVRCRSDLFQLWFRKRAQRVISSQSPCARCFLSTLS
ncbi:unnamed protein product, partial [Scytosiphon promiscuus]